MNKKPVFSFPQCLATIASVYWRSNEESVVGDRPQKTLMESREPVFAGNTRADRVQGEKRTSENIGRLSRDYRAILKSNFAFFPFIAAAAVCMLSCSLPPSPS